MPVVEVVDVVDVFEGEQDKQWMTKHRANTRVLEQEYIQLALLQDRRGVTKLQISRPWKPPEPPEPAQPAGPSVFLLKK